MIQAESPEPPIGHLPSSTQSGTSSAAESTSFQATSGDIHFSGQSVGGSVEAGKEREVYPAMSSQSNKRKLAEIFPDRAVWPRVESDPGVFTQMCGQYCTSAVTVEELHTTEVHEISRSGPIYGLIFSYKYYEDPLPEDIEKDDDAKGDMFFSCQITRNVSASSALLHVLLNNTNIGLVPEIQDLKEFTRGMDAKVAGAAIANSLLIRNTHDAAAGFQALMDLQTEASKKPTKSRKTKKNAKKWVDDDFYHFISYIPYNGFVWELDSLKSRPIRLASYSGSDWVTAALPILQHRMEECVEHDIIFDLLAVTRSHRLYFETAVDYAGRLKQTIEDRLSKEETEWRQRYQQIRDRGFTINVEPDQDLTGLDQEQISAVANSTAARASVIGLLQHYSAVEQYEQNMLDLDRSEKERMQTYETEWTKRRHNYTLAINSILTAFHEKNILQKYI
ncbi:ubiquitin carboxyl-terminal hydrolase [Radiomyces spectabilis]|uniref:ubiquitin carboxyl-terminal hydrolase n=1 Tax=Radiomyces spectabilis TaxID=64574 RepID=UPI00221F774C|nr:ubiquitin carboxyl-terminal hydrolase [Radiomyces spectabilis]KAI8369360.1 ubiquitin carboxyl-terminal hydrolase [Radiomyces spectabilis]